MLHHFSYNRVLYVLEEYGVILYSESKWMNVHELDGKKNAE